VLQGELVADLGKEYGLGVDLEVRSTFYLGH
jgi:hypothetical protein